MAGQNTERYMEMQMDELNEFLDAKKEVEPKKKKPVRNEKNRQVAELYEDCWEYEEDLAAFEAELEVIQNSTLATLPEALMQAFDLPDRDFKNELKGLIEAAWHEKVEVQKTHPKEQLEVIRNSEYNDIVANLEERFSSYAGDFSKEIMDLFIARWQMLIGIKKDHIKEEIAEIKTAGLKPHYAKRIYKEYHGIE